jgi:hypothetical protein
MGSRQWAMGKRFTTEGRGGEIGDRGREHEGLVARGNAAR